jgi:hypothetical protein
VSYKDFVLYLDQDFYLGDCLRLLFSDEDQVRQPVCLLPDGLDVHTPDFCLTVHQVPTYATLFQIEIRISGNTVERSTEVLCHTWMPSCSYNKATFTYSDAYAFLRLIEPDLEFCG